MRPGDLWTRDAGIGWPEVRSETPEVLQRVLKQKDEAVALWQQIVSLAEEVQWPDPALADFAHGSVHYGLGLARIYQALFHLDAAKRTDDDAAIRRGIHAYEKAWQEYEALPSRFSTLSTLYQRSYRLHIQHPADLVVNELKKQRKAIQNHDH